MHISKLLQKKKIKRAEGERVKRERGDGGGERESESLGNGNGADIPITYIPLLFYPSSLSAGG